MPDAKTTGASAGDGAARSREHNQGNQERKYTVEQKAAVLRIRRCGATAFYEILGLEEVRSSCTEADIKKAYRKLSLLTHPDKNGHEHADEAFKMVSRAFSVLGDKEKREKFDRFGTDPDSRFQSAAARDPFAGAGGFAARPGGGPGPGAGMWEEEISPEEMFNRFFGGTAFGPAFGNGMFDTGPQFVFNIGGGPGIRVHQFGGARPRRRPRDPNAPEPQASLWDTIVGMLPLLILLLVPILSSLMSDGSARPATPEMVFDAAHPPFTLHRQTPNYKVDYFVDPADVETYSAHKFAQLDKTAEVKLVNGLQAQCEDEKMKRQRHLNDATGWFFHDQEKMQKAMTMEMPACERLTQMAQRGPR